MGFLTSIGKAIARGRSSGAKIYKGAKGLGTKLYKGVKDMWAKLKNMFSGGGGQAKGRVGKETIIKAGPRSESAVKAPMQSGTPWAYKGTKFKKGSRPPADPDLGL
tara:strand:+ start:31 stop:348 length:318 start_codon:yes stop_codon:yes gene_type:complete